MNRTNMNMVILVLVGLTTAVDLIKTKKKYFIFHKH